MSDYIERPRYQCALGGALVTITALDRFIPIVHSAPGCASSAEGAASSGSGYWGSAYCNGRATPSSNTLEKEIIFGGEERLKEQIESTLSIIDGDLFAVITGCMTDIIGDDVRAIAADFQSAGKPVIVAETGGFKGNSSKGYDYILEAIFTQYTEKGLEKNPKLVNLLGLIPTQDVFWRGNLIELKRLLNGLGLEVNTFFTPSDIVEDLKTASKAALNIVFSDVHGIAAAKVFEETHGTPFISVPLPIGPTATKEFLEEVGRNFEICSKKVQDLVKKENAWYYSFVQSIGDVYNDIDLQRHAIIVGDANYSFALTKFAVDELGWIPAYVAVTDILDENEKEKVKSRFDSIPEDLRPKVIFETNTSEIVTSIFEDLKNTDNVYGDLSITPAFVLGSTLDRTLAAEVNAGFLSVTFPVTNRVVTDQGYAGYKGGLRLTTDIFSILLGNR